MAEIVSLWEIWNMLTVSFAVTLSQYHPPHHTSKTHTSTQSPDQVVDVTLYIVLHEEWNIS